MSDHQSAADVSDRVRALATQPYRTKQGHTVVPGATQHNAVAQDRSTLALCLFSLRQKAATMEHQLHALSMNIDAITGPGGLPLPAPPPDQNEAFLPEFQRLLAVLDHYEDTFGSQNQRLSIALAGVPGAGRTS